MAWTYVVKELVTGTTIDFVELEQVEITSELNASATMSAAFPLRHQKAKTSTFDVGRVAIWALDGDIVRFGGILTEANPDTSDDKLQLEVVDYWSWFFTRFLSQTVDYVGKTIQVALVGSGAGPDRGLLYRALNETPYRPHGIVLGTEQNGTVFFTEARYDGFELVNIARTVEDMSTGDQAFDYVMEPGGSLESGFVSTFKFWSPTRLRRTKLRWGISDKGGDSTLIDSFEMSIDGTQIANKIWVLGEGEGTSMLVSQAQDAIAFSEEYPLYEAVLSYKNIKTQAELDKIAARQSRNLSHPVNTYSVTLKPNHPSTQLGTFVLGDTVHLTVDWGFVQINKEVRINSRTINVLDETGDHRVTVDMVDYIP